MTLLTMTTFCLIVTCITENQREAAGKRKTVYRTVCDQCAWHWSSPVICTFHGAAYTEDSPRSWGRFPSQKADSAQYLRLAVPTESLRRQVGFRGWRAVSPSAQAQRWALGEDGDVRGMFSSPGGFVVQWLRVIQTHGCLHITQMVPFKIPFRGNGGNWSHSQDHKSIATLQIEHLNDI